MKLKQLSRVLIKTEIEAITAMEAEAEFYAGRPGPEGRAAELFSRLSSEKRALLRDLGNMLKESTGFRQRRMPPPGQLAAALRAHIAREEELAALFPELARQLNNPDYKEAAKGMAALAYAHMTAVRDLRASLK